MSRYCKRGHLKVALDSGKLYCYICERNRKGRDHWGNIDLPKLSRGPAILPEEVRNLEDEMEPTSIGVSEVYKLGERTNVGGRPSFSRFHQ